MFEDRKWLIGVILGSMVVSGIGIIDEIVVKGIITTSASIAFALVGGLYSASLISTRADGGKARIIIFVILIVLFMNIFILVTQFFTWLLSGPIWLYILILVLSPVLLVLHIRKNALIRNEYIEESLKHKDAAFQTVSIIDNETSGKNIIELKTIYQLLAENKDKECIYIEKINDHSPNLEYVKVSQKALEYPVLKGYFKMDKAGFFAEIYYSDKKIWKLVN